MYIARIKARSCRSFTWRSRPAKRLIDQLDVQSTMQRHQWGACRTLAIFVTYLCWKKFCANCVIVGYVVICLNFRLRMSIGYSKRWVDLNYRQSGSWQLDKNRDYRLWSRTLHERRIMDRYNHDIPETTGSDCLVVYSPSRDNEPRCRTSLRLAR